MTALLIDMTMSLRIVYDVEDNLYSKEEMAQKSDDKPYSLGKIRAYQNKSKA